MYHQILSQTRSAAAAHTPPKLPPRSKPPTTPAPTTLERVLTPEFDLSCGRRRDGWRLPVGLARARLHRRRPRRARRRRRLRAAPSQLAASLPTRGYEHLTSRAGLFSSHRVPGALPSAARVVRALWSRSLASTSGRPTALPPRAHTARMPLAHHPSADQVVTLSTPLRMHAISRVSPQVQRGGGHGAVPRGTWTSRRVRAGRHVPEGRAPDVVFASEEGRLEVSHTL